MGNNGGDFKSASVWEDEIIIGRAFLGSFRIPSLLLSAFFSFNQNFTLINRNTISKKSSYP